MKKTILSVLLLSITAIAGAQTITIAKQGHFSVGGQTIQRPGAYDNSKFVGWAEQRTRRAHVRNNYGKARGRRDVLVRYMAHRYLAELQRGRAIPERFRIAFTIFPRNDA